jgi:hypothetical protein
MQRVKNTGVHFSNIILNFVEQYGNVKILELYWSKYGYYKISIMSDEN